MNSLLNNILKKMLMFHFLSKMLYHLIMQVERAMLKIIFILNFLPLHILNYSFSNDISSL